MSELPSERTPKEKVIDKLLLLYLLNKHRINGRTKLQKTVFFSEDSLNNKNVKSFNYKFIRFHFGEFSRELESDFKELIKDELILEKPYIRVTEEGENVLKQLEGVLKKNPNVLNLVDAISDYASRKPLDVVKTMAYTRVIRNGIQVKDIPEEVVLLEKINESKAESVFNINDGWIGTLELLFDKTSADSLKVALTEKANIPFMV